MYYGVYIYIKQVVVVLYICNLIIAINNYIILQEYKIKDHVYRYGPHLVQIGFLGPAH